MHGDNALLRIVVYLGSSRIFYIMSRAMLIKFVQENIQSNTQGFPNVLFNMTILLSSLYFRLMLTYLSQTMFVMIVIVCVSLAWYITEEHPYRNVQVIDVNYEIISRSYVNEAKIETIYDVVNACFKNNFQKLLR